MGIKPYLWKFFFQFYSLPALFYTSKIIERMSVSLNLIHVLIVGITFLALSIILNRKFDLYNTWITVIKKFGPIWLVFFPPFITYLIICGTFSMLTVEIYKFVIGGDKFVFVPLDYQEGQFFICPPSRYQISNRI